MLKWMLTCAALAALAVPVAAAADSAPAPAVKKGTAVEGKAISLQGRGFLRAELSAAAGAKAVEVRGRAGFVRFVDLGGDMKVQCNGQGADRTRQNDEGQTVVVCMGRGGRATVSGSHFRLGGFAMRFGIAIPDGYTGTVRGHLSAWDGSDDSLAADEDSAPQSEGAKAVSTIDAALAAALKR